MHLQLVSKARRGFRGYPVATIAFFGPDLRRANKVAVAIVPGEDAEATALARWTLEHGDVRGDTVISESVFAFVKRHAASSVVMTAGIVGCPHEDGVDFPEGGVCPHCPYWSARMRWTESRRLARSRMSGFPSAAATAS